LLVASVIEKSESHHQNDPGAARLAVIFFGEWIPMKVAPVIVFRPEHVFVHVLHDTIPFLGTQFDPYDLELI